MAMAVAERSATIFIILSSSIRRMRFHHFNLCVNLITPNRSFCHLEQFSQFSQLRRKHSLSRYSVRGRIISLFIFFFPVHLVGWRTNCPNASAAADDGDFFPPCRSISSRSHCEFYDTMNFNSPPLFRTLSTSPSSLVVACECVAHWPFLHVACWAFVCVSECIEQCSPWHRIRLSCCFTWMINCRDVREFYSNFLPSDFFVSAPTMRTSFTDALALSLREERIYVFHSRISVYMCVVRALFTKFNWSKETDSIRLPFCAHVCACDLSRDRSTYAPR